MVYLITLAILLSHHFNDTQISKLPQIIFFIFFGFTKKVKILIKLHFTLQFIILHYILLISNQLILPKSSSTNFGCLRVLAEVIWCRNMLRSKAFDIEQVYELYAYLFHTMVHCSELVHIGSISCCGLIIAVFVFFLVLGIIMWSFRPVLFEGAMLHLSWDDWFCKGRCPFDSCHWRISDFCIPIGIGILNLYL